LDVGVLSTNALVMPAAVWPIDSFCTSGFSHTDLAGRSAETEPDVLFSVAGKREEWLDGFMLAYALGNSPQWQAIFVPHY